MKKLLLFSLFFFFLLRSQPTQAQGVQQVVFTTADFYLVVELLDDDLVHFETGMGSPSDGPIVTSPMVDKTDYTGPTEFANNGQGVLTTADLQITIHPQTLCSTLVDLTHEPPLELTAVCPQDLAERKKSLTIDPTSMQNVYGLGQQFRTPGEPNGDWVGSRRTPGIVGNEMQGFSGGAVGNTQFPVMYALGEGHNNYALFVDVVYKQEWDFTSTPWTMTSSADPLRWYVMSGSNLPDLRADYMELIGRSPVPPRAMFGLWVSEYGYDNWAELDDKRQTLDENQFPQDGFVLDLLWFGGIQTPSQMGSLSWDLEDFPDPAAKIAQLQTEEGLNIVVIEESYVDQGLSNFGRMASQSYLVKSCESCGPVVLAGKWWGTGGMVDWTNEAGAATWHDANRQPLIEAGVMGHWTDLGEPEMFAPTSWYAGLPGLNLHDQLANHNIYNLLWAQSIFQGYERNQVTQRPIILSRSGTSGIQRYGTAMWSADIGSNFDSLATHMNAQMHMSFSGMDYFGSDIGGFHRGSISEAELDELYTAWFANSSLLDVPVRPHTENLCNCKETAPDRVGDVASNLANIRLRYALTPYLYSLAHQAYLTGAPVVPPLVFYFQDDPQTRQLGDHKLLGENLLVRTVTEAGAVETAVYLPAGHWVNFRTGEWVQSSGEWLENVPVRPNGLFQLPLFARAGAIVPQLFVDEQTMNLYGMRRDGTTRDELILYIVPSPQPTTFTLFEDDGRSVAYQSGEVRTTILSQQWQNGQMQVDIAAAEGSFAGANSERNTVLQMAIGNETVTAVSLNNTSLSQYPTQADWETAESGWFATDGYLWVKTGVSAIAEAKQVVVTVEQNSLVAETEGGEGETAVSEDATTSEPTPDRTTLYSTLLTVVILILLIGGWFYIRKS